MDLQKHQTITSLEIAELTGKSHFHIMRDIRNITDNLDIQGITTASNFGFSNYLDSTGRQLPMFQLTKKGALVLASGYDPVLRYKIIDRLEQLELEKRVASSSTEAPTPRQLAYLVLKLEDEKDKLQNELNIAAPKVEYTDKVLTSMSGILTTQIAKELGTTAQKLNRFLELKKVQYKRNGQWILAAKYQNLQYTETITSLEITELTGKMHYNVIRDIRAIIQSFDNQ